MKEVYLDQPPHKTDKKYAPTIALRVKQLMHHLRVAEARRAEILPAALQNLRGFTVHPLPNPCRSPTVERFRQCLGRSKVVPVRCVF